MNSDQATATQRALDAALYEPLPEPEVRELFGALGWLLFRAESEDFAPTLPMELIP